MTRLTSIYLSRLGAVTLLALAPMSYASGRYESKVQFGIGAVPAARYAEDVTSLNAQMPGGDPTDSSPRDEVEARVASFRHWALGHFSSELRAYDTATEIQQLSHASGAVAPVWSSRISRVGEESRKEIERVYLDKVDQFSTTHRAKKFGEVARLAALWVFNEYLPENCDVLFSRPTPPPPIEEP